MTLGKADLHIHTHHSDGINNPNSLLKRAKDRGLQVIAITDHNTLNGALETKKLEKQFGVSVIIGEEISSTAGHISGLFLEHSIPRDLPPEETIKRIHRQGGVAIITHPLAPAPRSVNLIVLDQLVNHEDLACRPDALEVLNGFPWNFPRSKQLLSLNAKFDLAEVGGSDSHGPVSLGCIYTSFEGSTPADLKRSILARSTSAHGKPWPTIELIRALGKDAVYRSKKLLARHK